MQLYNQIWQKPKLKDPRTSNDKTQFHIDVGGVGAWESIKLGWLQGFKLNELNAR
jgi:hypothetical protein